MSGLGVTDPSEVYFKDGVWGWLTNQWQKLIVNASHHLKVEIASADATVSVAESAPVKRDVCVEGWGDVAWDKLSLLWGYDDRYVECEQNAYTGAGAELLTFSTVPVGEVWVVKRFVAYGTSTTITFIVLLYYDGSADRTLHCVAFPGNTITTGLDCDLILKAGDCLKVGFVDCSSGDSISANAFGYKMDVS